MSKEKVYDAFAELIYTVVMADGLVKEPEKSAIENIVKDHPIAQNIQRYFDSNMTNNSVAQSFLHALEVCRENGQDSEYPFLIRIVEEISKVSEGLNGDDDGLLTEFVSNFKRKFAAN
jgi:hypothetical protein